MKSIATFHLSACSQSTCTRKEIDDFPDSATKD
jgi:hypothetical protein